MRLPWRNAWLIWFPGSLEWQFLALRKSENCFLYDRFLPNLNIIQTYERGTPLIDHWSGIARLEENGELLIIMAYDATHRPTAFDIEKERDGTVLFRLRRVRRAQLLLGALAIPYFASETLLFSCQLVIALSHITI